jgi:hypothetical protein
MSNAGHGGLLRLDEVECIFWGDVFRRKGRFLGVDDLEQLDGDDITDPAEIELLGRWWAEAAATDTAVVPPGERTLGGGFPVQSALAALSGSRFLAGVTERVLIHVLNQVRAYFTDSEKRAEIQARFAAVVSDDTRVVVGHSLGSVIAYEGLCAHPEWKIRHFVTLGSPLGIRNIVLDRLVPAPARDRSSNTVRGRWPEGVTKWTNIADRRDFVALIKRLHAVFAPEVVDIVIDNGARWHDVTRYLTAVETGEAIAAGLGGYDA